jgi:hypothetical protein
MKLVEMHVMEIIMNVIDRQTPKEVLFVNQIYGILLILLEYGLLRFFFFTEVIRCYFLFFCR